MKKKVSKFQVMVLVLVAVLLIPQNAYAMHIAEGYLQPWWCIGWGILCVPFIVRGFITIKKKVAVSSKHLVLFAMCGAFAFVMSALKIPSVTGSCSHPTGVGLGAILFGPSAMAVIGVIILLFQAILLAHGGVSTLGANTFSMAIVGPLVSYGVFRLCKRWKFNNGVAVFSAAALGNLLTYVMTSVQLALAFPDGGTGVMGSLMKFLAVFALTQLPLAICEGLVTVVIYNVLEKYSKKELMELKVL